MAQYQNSRPQRTLCTLANSDFKDHKYQGEGEGTQTRAIISANTTMHTNNWYHSQVRSSASDRDDWFQPSMPPFRNMLD